MTLPEIIAYFECAERGEEGDRIADYLDQAYTYLLDAQERMDQIGEGAMADEVQRFFGD